MKLIDEWKQAWKLLSVQANGISVAMTGAYVALPEKMQDILPAKYVLLAAGAIAVLGTIGRVIQQKPKDEAPK
jgi:hypothetical protein